MYLISLHLITSLIVWNSFMHVCTTFYCILHREKKKTEWNSCNILCQKKNKFFMITLQQGKNQKIMFLLGFILIKGLWPPFPPSVKCNNFAFDLCRYSSVIYISVISNQAFVFPLPFSIILGVGFWLVPSETVSFFWWTTCKISQYKE